MAKKNLQLLSVLSLMLSLPLLIWAAVQVTSYLSKAAVIKANIVVDTTVTEGNLPGNWLNFAQGGEEVDGMLTKTVPYMKLLKPKYIRLDHIFDNYSIVMENGTFNFEKLDKTVNEILAMGAKPFFSLSYMPRQYSNNNSVIENPRDWTLWKDLVRQTIEHYSGKKTKNIANVYYEVWNEPDLPQFGSFKLTGEKNYNLLYKYSSDGALEAKNVNKFFLGGPAVGSFYPEWVNNFVSYARENNLKLDFYSWHRYHRSPSKFREDAVKIRKILNNYPKFSNLPLVLSEWGIDSENNQNSNTQKAASHALATIFNIYDAIDMPFVFEIKDGLPPTGGKWGLMTHEKDQNSLSLKPRFRAFAASTLLIGTKLRTNGWGSNVQALASRSLDNTIYVLINNYDQKESNLENVPLTLTGLTPGFYKITNRNINTNTSNIKELSSTNGQLREQILMLPNSITLLEVRKSGNFAQYTGGVSGEISDKALILSQNNDLRLSPFEFEISPDLNINFDIKPFFTGSQNPQLNILEAEIANPDGRKISINLKKITSNDIDFIFTAISDGFVEERFSLPINNWKDESWHSINVSLNNRMLKLTVDDSVEEKSSQILSDKGKVSALNFYPFNGALDNLILSRNNEIIFQKDFN